MPRGIVKAAETVDLNMPLVIRLEGGNNSKLGMEIIERSNLNIHTVKTMDEGAKKNHRINTVER